MTRTTSPYFSPKKAMAPRSAASFCDISMDRTASLAMTCWLARSSISLQLLGGDGGVVAEVEAQPVGRDQRSGLLDVGPEHLPQGPVEQVGAGVVAADGLPSGGVDGGGGLLAGGHLAFDEPGQVAAEAGKGVGGVDHLAGCRWRW